jgi:hypothetical protein
MVRAVLFVCGQLIDKQQLDPEWMEVFPGAGREEAAPVAICGECEVIGASTEQDLYCRIGHYRS